MTINHYKQDLGQPLQKDHQLNMKNRKSLDLTGVKEIDSFDHEEFLIETVMGYLIVRGNHLQLKNLDVSEGLVTIEGKIYELSYIDEQTEKAKGFFSKLFK